MRCGLHLRPCDNTVRAVLAGLLLQRYDGDGQHQQVTAVQRRGHHQERACSDSTSCGKCTCLGTGGEPTRGFLARRPHGPLLHAPPTALCTTPLAMHRHACQCAFFVISRTLVPVNRPPRSVRGWNRQVLCILHGRHLLPWRRLVRQSNCLPAVFDWPSIAAQIHRGGQLHIVHGPHNSRCR